MELFVESASKNCFLPHKKGRISRFCPFYIDPVHCYFFAGAAFAGAEAAPFAGAAAGVAAASSCFS